MSRDQLDFFGLIAAERNEPDPHKRRTATLSPNSAITERLVQSAISIDPSTDRELTFQHTVFCQTAMPYRNPGDVRRWERINGCITLDIEAGRARDLKTGRHVEVPLPFGPRARLVLMHLNAMALRSGKRSIEVDDSLTSFVQRIIGRDPGGRDITMVKNQLTALSAALVRLSTGDETTAVQIDSKIVSGFNLWAPTDPKQKILWPSVVRLSEEYFTSLMTHAVPLDERAIGALAHSARALDIYTWLAQRLHRVDPGRPQFIGWSALQEQFGFDYKRIRDFRRQFLHALRQVHSQYPQARVETDKRGVTLRQSPPPISHQTKPLASPRK